MTNIINVDFTMPKTFEDMLKETRKRQTETILIKNIGDTDVYSDEHFVCIKVDGETVLTFSRESSKGLLDLVKALESQIL